MICGTTPTHVFVLPFDVDLIKSIRIIYAQAGEVVMTKENEDLQLEGNSVRYKLTQEETLAFDDSKRVEIQVRVLTVDGDALASDIYSVFAERCLERSVIE